MLSRNELMHTPCWTCWWKEGGRCYNKTIAEVRHCEGGRIEGQEITEDLIRICDASCTYKSKRAFLESVFPKDVQIVITSEHAKE